MMVFILRPVRISASRELKSSGRCAIRIPPSTLTIWQNSLITGCQKDEIRNLVELVYWLTTDTVASSALGTFISIFQNASCHLLMTVSSVGTQYPMILLR